MIHVTLKMKFDLCILMHHMYAVYLVLCISSSGSVPSCKSRAVLPKVPLLW